MLTFKSEKCCFGIPDKQLVDQAPLWNVQYFWQKRENQKTNKTRTNSANPCRWELKQQILHIPTTAKKQNQILQIVESFWESGCCLFSISVHVDQWARISSSAPAGEEEI